MFGKLSSSFKVKSGAKWIRDHSPAHKKTESHDKGKTTTKTRSVLPNEVDTKNENSKVKLVVFDKDGTLVCFHSMWAPWCEELVRRLEARTGLQLASDLYKYLCYDPDSRKIGLGPLAEKTHSCLRADVTRLLCEKYELSLAEVEQLLANEWKSWYVDCDDAVEPVGDVHAVLSALKLHGVKVAICTSDSRDSTVRALQSMGVLELIDAMVCGDDCDNVPKPSPDNLLRLCRDLDVDVECSVVIGDTPADTGMGRSGGAGLVLGVLSGVGSCDSLRSEADLVVENVVDALPIILQHTVAL